MSLKLSPNILNTDLYQLTMAAGYFQHQMHQQPASFELYVRRLPFQRQFLVAAGLEQALSYLENLRFEPEQIAWLQAQPVFSRVSPAFFDYLQSFRFEGEVWALPEGSLFFPYEPILRITAPLLQAQLVETWLLAMLNYQTSVASKAARISLMLQDHSQSRSSFVDFGSRRAHGPEAALLAARAAYIGGAAGTSNVAAAQALDLPVVGTAAHAWTMAFATEPEAFAAYHQAFPEHSTLLVDTYDTLQGVKNAMACSPDLKGIRLDSGDFLALSQASRQLLDQAGCTQTRIVVSGDMNEYKVRDLLQAGAPIDVFGIGTELVTSIDAPSLGGVYKLVELEQAGKKRYGLKLSAGKTAYPGCKQIWRQQAANGLLAGDLLGLSSETQPGTPLLQCVMQHGQRLKPPESLAQIQARTLQGLQALPPELRQLESESPYAVEQSEALIHLFMQVKQQLQPAQEVK